MLKGIQPKQRNAEQIMQFNGFPHGLNTATPPDRIAQTEASKLVNCMILRGGKLESRSPAVTYSANATTSNAAIKTIEEVNIGGTIYTLVVDENYVLYYVDSNKELQSIGTLEGATTIMSFNGVAMLFDGSYIKFLDGVSSVKLAYDSGSGTRAYQFDHSGLTNNAFLALGDGTNLGVAQKFTTQAWTAGYTIPPVTVSAYLSENGSAPTGAITAKIRSFADPSIVLASMTFVADASEVGGTAAEFTATFAPAEVTTQLSPSTAYLATLEYAAGDAANYIKVHCNNIGSAGLAYYGDTDLDVIGNWNADTAKQCLMSLTPTRPPKGKFGTIWNKRPWVGGDPDNPGYEWYGNLTHLDWSTPDGGGYLGLIDGDADTFECGGMANLFGSLYAFGKQSQPYLVKISGTSPSDYVQETVFQRPWATHQTIKSAVNDLWFANADGVAPLSGVQEYGDLRTFFASDPVVDRIENYWDSDTAFAQYYPIDGQYWLVMPAYHRILIFHTKHPIADPDGSGYRFPCSEYEFYRYELTSSAYRWVANGTEYYLQKAVGTDPEIIAQPDFLTLNGDKLTEGTAGSLSDHQWDYGLDPSGTYNTIYFKDASGDPDDTGISLRAVLLPTALGSADGGFLLGGSDGYLHKLDADDYKDLEAIQIEPIVRTAYMEIPFTHANFNQVQLLASSEGGGSFTLNFYKNNLYRTPASTKTILLPIKDNLLVDDATMDVDDAVFLVDAETRPLFEHLNFNARAVMIEMTDVFMSGYPVFNHGFILKYRPLGY